MQKKIAVVGLGWLGLPLAKSLAEKGYFLIGSTTREEKLMRLSKSNLSARIIKVTKNNVEGNWTNFIKNVDLLIINLPPRNKVNEKKDYPMQINQLVSRCEPKLKVIFVSSTSVYKNTNDHAKEDESVHLDLEAGAVLLEAETIVRNHFKNNATIVRFAGLIGEGRHPGKFLKRAEMIKNPTGKVNLIRLSDCIELIDKIYHQNYFGEIVNGCADDHPTRKEFYTKAAESLTLSPPSFEADQKEEWKIVNNEKSKRELGMIYSSIWDEI